MDGASVARRSANCGALRGRSGGMRGDQQASSAETTANNNANTFGGNAAALYSTTVPQLTAEATAPAGYSPSDLAAMNTGAEQSAGGAEAGAVGQGGLMAARTRNKGAF